jgi:hypothetical protein
MPRTKKTPGPHPSNNPEVVPLSDREWAEISETIALPKDGRTRIGAALAFYESGRAASKAASLKTKRSIDKVRRYAAKVDDELRQILADPTFYVAGQPYWSSRQRPNKADFTELFSNLKQLQSTMKMAQSRMAMSPGRKSTQAIDNLVQQLNYIQAEVSRDTVQRSTKDSEAAKSKRPAKVNKYVILCGKKVGLTSPQIQRALKRTIAIFHDTLTNHRFDTSVGEYIDDGYSPISRRSRTAEDGHWRIRQKGRHRVYESKRKVIVRSDFWASGVRLATAPHRHPIPRLPTHSPTRAATDPRQHLFDRPSIWVCDQF